MWQAVQVLDIPVIMGIVLTGTVAIDSTNLPVDLSGYIAQRAGRRGS